MDPLSSFKNSLKQSFMSKTHTGEGFYSPMRTGVSDFLKNKKTKQYEFAEKPNYVNPFNTSGTRETFDVDSESSPLKKNSILRRHTDNYGTLSTNDEDFSAQLTPCRWNETGWKYEKKGTDYFKHENKNKNQLGLSYHKLNDIKKVPLEHKTQYRSSFKGKSFVDHDGSKQKETTSN
jgi:hypothetical protein